MSRGRAGLPVAGGRGRLAVSRRRGRGLRGLRLENDPVLKELGVRTTTNPIQLALWAGSGPVV
ncbi:hypothetical protein ABZX63_05780, partial [Streptomyces tendae]